MALATWWRGDSVPLLSLLPGFRVEASRDAHLVAHITRLAPDEAEQRMHSGHQPHPSDRTGARLAAALAPAFSPPVANNPPTNPPLVGCGSTPASAMLCLSMIQDSAERTMSLHYYITVKEHLDDSWSTWFDGLTITHAADGTTTLAGSVRDQSALYGLIDHRASQDGCSVACVGEAHVLKLVGPAGIKVSLEAKVPFSSLHPFLMYGRPVCRTGTA